MKKEIKEKIKWVLGIMAVWGIVAFSSLTFSGVIQIDRNKEEQKIITVDETVLLPYSAGAKEKTDVKEITASETEEGWVELDSEKVEGEDAVIIKMKDNWKPSNIKISLMEDTLEKKTEEMTPEEAADIGLSYLHDCLGMEEGKDLTVEMILAEKGMRKEESGVRRYEGYFTNPSDMMRYAFMVDAVNGHILYMYKLITVEMLDFTEEERSKRKEIIEKMEKDKTEPAISTQDFVKLQELTGWRKITRKAIKEYGLNYGKAVNTTLIMDFKDARNASPWVVMECFLDEVSGQTQHLELGFDIRTKEMMSFVNVTLLGLE